jgi:phage tail P2-like protein
MTPSEAVAAIAPLADAIAERGGITTKLARAVFTAELARLAAIDPTVIARIWNPWSCPAALLPWLAQGVSVDVWSDAWPEATKRAVIAASPDVHRKKGTIGAVRKALAAFALDATIVEWWQDDSRRGTFRIDILYRSGGPAFDPTTQAYVIAAASAAKPKSRVLTVRAIMPARATLGVAAFGRTQIIATAHPYLLTPPVLRATSVVAATAASIMSATAHRKAA